MRAYLRACLYTWCSHGQRCSDQQALTHAYGQSQVRVNGTRGEERARHEVIGANVRMEKLLHVAAAGVRTIIDANIRWYIFAMCSDPSTIHRLG